MVLKEVLLPAMGEGITEASIIRWLVEEGDSVIMDQPLVEIATDKVDSEIPSPFEGIIKNIITPVGSIPQVGEKLALIAVAGEEEQVSESVIELPEKESVPNPVFKRETTQKRQIEIFYSSDDLPFAPPYVRMVAQKLKISLPELAAFCGKKTGDTFNKTDIESFIKVRDYSVSNDIINKPVVKSFFEIQPKAMQEKSPLAGYSGPYRTEEMSRIRKRIAGNMVKSSSTIPHVTSYIEADVSNMASWRENHKDEFFRKYNTKLTFTPLFIEAIIAGLKKYPEVNVSIDGNNIIYKDHINIGMATILPDKDLIVPVIKQADTMNLHGLALSVNDLSARAREKELKLEEISGSTFTFTNIGVFGTLTGTPLINLPEAAILAIGSINKKPDVIKINEGYSIGIRDKVILSLAYDHRVIDGGLGGQFLKAVADSIESFNLKRAV